MDICIYKIHQGLHLNILSVCVLVWGQGIVQNAQVRSTWKRWVWWYKVYVGRREYFSLKAPDRKQMEEARQLFHHWRIIGVTFGGIIHACYSSPPPHHGQSFVSTVGGENNKTKTPTGSLTPAALSSPEPCSMKNAFKKEGLDSSLKAQTSRKRLFSKFYFRRFGKLKGAQVHPPTLNGHKLIRLSLCALGGRHCQMKRWLLLATHGGAERTAHTPEQIFMPEPNTADVYCVG